MIKVLLVLQVFVTVALIAVILIQRSEGGGLGLGGGQGMGSFMSGRGTANLLTRITAILAVAFFVLSLGLALLYKGSAADNGTAAILNGPVPAAPVVPTPGSAGAGAGALQPSSLPKTPVDAVPAPTSAPSAPVSAPPAPVSPAPSSVPAGTAPGNGQ